MVIDNDFNLSCNKMIINYLRQKYNFVFKQPYFNDLFSYCRVFIFEHYSKRYDEKKSNKTTYIYCLCQSAVGHFFRENNKHFKNDKISLNMTVDFDNKNLELQEIIKDNYDFFEDYDNKDYIKKIYKKCIDFIDNDLLSLNNRKATDKVRKLTKIIFKCKIFTNHTITDIAFKLKVSHQYCSKLYNLCLTQLREYFKKYNYFL